MRRLLALVGLLLAQPDAALAQASADFTLRPGDRVQVYHWRDETVRGEFPVEEDGNVVLPLLGRRAVTGNVWRVVADSLRAAYARELRAADLRITPMRRVYVVGFVKEPGVHFADPTLTLGAVLAMAGGASPEGDLARVRLVRAGRVVFDQLDMNAGLSDVAYESGDQIFVGRRGWFDRNSAFMVSAIVGLAGIVVTLLVAN